MIFTTSLPLPGASIYPLIAQTRHPAVIAYRAAPEIRLGCWNRAGKKFKINLRRDTASNENLESNLPEVAVMSLGAAVLSYAAIAGVLILAMVALAAREKARGKAIFARENWNFLLALRPRKMLTGEMWLMIIAAAFITLCAGVIIVVFILPFGFAWAAAAMVATIAALLGLMAKPLK